MKKLFVLLTLLSISISYLNAQTSLYGTITGDEKQAINSGSIILYNDDTLPINTEIDASGRYHFSNIEPGIYNIEAAFKGYFTQSYHNVSVIANKPISLDIRMTSNTISLNECLSKLPTRNTNLISTNFKSRALVDRGDNIVIKGIDGGRFSYIRCILYMDYLEYSAMVSELSELLDEGGSLEAQYHDTSEIEQQ